MPSQNSSKSTSTKQKSRNSKSRNSSNSRNASRNSSNSRSTRNSRNSSNSRNFRGRNSSRNSQGNSQRRNSKGRSRFAKSKAIDINLFQNDVVEITPEEEIEIQNTFADFDFDERLTANIVKKGYVTPTPIQDQTIHHALEGRDVLGMANTGTGKTAAFVLPIINALTKIKKQSTRALIIAPTRELAQQIEQEFRSFTSGLKLYSTICVGGLSIHKQKIQLRRNPHVVIGTPGRIKDLMGQGALNLKDVSMFVLDEVDLMLDMGFIDDINDIVAEIPQERQTLFFSATMTKTINNLIETIMSNPVTVSVKTGDTSANVQQDVVFAKSSKDKWEKMLGMFGSKDFEKILIFCETKHFVQRLCDDLNEYGVKADAIHGDKSQPQRQRALKKFKDDSVKVLVATDVAARGLDIPNVSHVINYDTPKIYEDYVHRIGRTGRAGKLGNAITFVKK